MNGIFDATREALIIIVPCGSYINVLFFSLVILKKKESRFEGKIQPIGYN